MPRKPLILSDEFPYHVCARSNNSEWFSVPMTVVWDAFTECLLKTQDLFSPSYHAFVLMGNHFHLLLSTPQANLGEVMLYLMTETSRRLARASNRINKIYGARYKWSILRGRYDYAYVYKYVIRNPVRAGACTRVEDYTFSTFSQLLNGKCEIPICDRIFREVGPIPRQRAELLSWLNRPTEKEIEELISLGLRRFDFQFSNDNSLQKSLRLLRQQYGIENEGEAGGL